VFGDNTSRVVIIPLSFQSSQNSLTLDDLELHALDLIMEEAIQRHPEDEVAKMLAGREVKMRRRCR
jgi:hypothetical protein